MRKRFGLWILAGVFILIFPVWFAPSPNENLTNSAPFSTVAIAGHVTPGGRYCPCDGECGNLNITSSDQQTSEQNDKENRADSTATDFVSGAVLVLLLAMYFGMRA